MKLRLVKLPEMIYKKLKKSSDQSGYTMVDIVSAVINNDPRLSDMQELQKMVAEWRIIRKKNK